jgi:hypothetical protein
MDRTKTVLGSGSAAGFWPGRFRLGGVGVGLGVVFAPDDGGGGGGEASPPDAEASAAEGAEQAEGAAAEKPADAKPPGSLLTDAADEKGGEAGEADKEAEAPKEPITYDDFTAPEGLDLSGPTMDAFKALAAEHGLSQQAAQGMVDLHAQTVAAQAEARAALVQGWADDAKADKEFGGAKFDASMGAARKALQAYGSPELVQVLAQSGFGNHPEVIRAFYRIGKTLGEDGKAPSASSAAAGGQEAVLRKMFPTHFKD